MSRSDHGARRRSGVLLPLSALIEPGGAAALGEPAERFLDFLSAAGFGIWQVLPVHPPDGWGSPYQARSVHAGDLRLIGEVPDEHLAAADDPGFGTFREEQSWWLRDWTQYRVLKAQHGDRPWWEWPEPLRRRDGHALREFESEHRALLDQCALRQYRFREHWIALRRYAHGKGILLMGDMPLFAAHDSADVWANTRYFRLDERGQPTVVAGVPPDYFSPTGQRWGSPVYDWERMQADGFRWWIDRLRTQLALFDLVRIDHFRGLEAIWEIPAHCTTAIDGVWQPAPGRELLLTLKHAFGRLPFIAEDLGIITPQVERLRRAFRLPGIKVLQFAFDSDAANPYLPHNHQADYAVYTGTHDNDTTLGWFRSLEPSMAERVSDYLGNSTEPIPWPMIGAALSSVCRYAIVPMQDLLGLDGAHRMNVPGTVHGNWNWRLPWAGVTPELAARLRRLNELYGRC